MSLWLFVEDGCPASATLEFLLRRCGLAFERSPVKRGSPTRDAVLLLCDGSSQLPVIDTADGCAFGLKASLAFCATNLPGWPADSVTETGQVDDVLADGTLSGAVMVAHTEAEFHVRWHALWQALNSQPDVIGLTEFLMLPALIDLHFLASLSPDHDFALPESARLAAALRRILTSEFEAAYMKRLRRARSWVCQRNLQRAIPNAATLDSPPLAA